MSILDPRFKYTSALSTNVMSTWKKFGFKPTTEAERIAREEERAAAYAAPAAPRRQPLAYKRRNTHSRGVSLHVCERAMGVY